jgi:hypothetical protein
LSKAQEKIDLARKDLRKAQDLYGNIKSMKDPDVNK